ncbi:MAG: low molecular weight phosphatase family protein [Anaerolineae bacterium]|nr:low molecular weight phosphatase family protein [Anaerolineae bacterium]
MNPEPTILFICTGNFYRSRFAEAVFNHRARALGLPQRAFSRGLATHTIDGDLSPWARQALEERGIPLDCTGPTRIPLTQHDLMRAQRIIALKEDEHRPLMERHFPLWADRIQYWHVHDLDVSEADEALPQIERLVEELIEDLRAEDGRA